MLYGLFGLAGVTVFASSLIVLHVVNPDIDWTRHYVSSFANGPLGWVFVGGALLHGAGNLALTFGLRRSLDPGAFREWAVVLLGAAAGGIGIVRWFPSIRLGLRRHSPVRLTAWPSPSLCRQKSQPWSFFRSRSIEIDDGGGAAGCRLFYR